jgi:hypothetical protein
MNPWLERVVHALRGLRSLAVRLPDDPRAHWFERYLQARTARERATTSATLALQCVPDLTFMVAMAEQARHLARQHGARIDLVVVRSVSGAVGLGVLASLKRSAPLTWLRMRQWRNMLGPLAPRVAYHSRSWARPLGDLCDLVLAWRAWRRAAASTGPFRMRIDGIEVGDLVVDSCLRFQPSPRFEARRAFVCALVWQAHRDVRRAQAYFRRHRPIAYLTSYTTYIEHGVAVRAALAAGVPVRAYGNLQRFGVPVTADYPYHTLDAGDYADGFARLDEPDAARREAERGLTARLAGGIDEATSYMRASAYGGGETAPADVRGAVVVFLHDFYDSPHVYADLVFDDFWAWITFTIDALEQDGTPYFLKPHPNQISLSEGVLGELRAARPRARFLSPRVSNVQLARQGMVCGVTVYGTVAHELAYLGIPSIACARHPHHSFGFCRTARSAEEYRRLLAEPDARPLSDAEMKRQALAFYYMHNLHGAPDDRALRGAFVEYWKCGDLGLEAWRPVFEHLVTRPGFERSAFV